MFLQLGVCFLCISPALAMYGLKPTPDEVHVPVVQPHELLVQVQPDEVQKDTNESSSDSSSEEEKEKVKKPDEPSQNNSTSMHFTLLKPLQLRTRAEKNSALVPKGELKAGDKIEVSKIQGTNVYIIVPKKGWLDLIQNKQPTMRKSGTIEQTAVEQTANASPSGSDITVTGDEGSPFAGNPMRPEQLPELNLDGDKPVENQETKVMKLQQRLKKCEAAARIKESPKYKNYDNQIFTTWKVKRRKRYLTGQIEVHLMTLPAFKGRTFLELKRCPKFRETLNDMVKKQSGEIKATKLALNEIAEIQRALKEEEAARKKAQETM